MSSPPKASPFSPSIARISESGLEPLLPRQLASELQRAALSPSLPADGLGFSAEQLESPDFRLPNEAIRRYSRKALELLGRTDLGLQIGAQTNPVSWDLCLVGMLAAADVAQMLSFAARFAPGLRGLVDLDCETGPDGVWVVAEPVFLDEVFSAFVVQAAFAALVALHRFVLGGTAAPLRAELSQRRPDDPQPFHDALRCRVVFGRPQDRILFPASPRQLATSNPETYARTEERLAAIHGAAASGQKDLLWHVRQAIRRSGYAPPTLAEIAARLHMGERTLRRRLNAHGLNFLNLVDEERRWRALRLIHSSGMSLKDIAVACGYSDTRSLRRAVSRWTGMSPSRLRQMEPGED